MVDLPFFPQEGEIENMGEGISGLVDYEPVVFYMLMQVLS